MIRDGVCDELTNNELCLYDGGDCCLNDGDKDTTLCDSCICQLTIDDKLISNAFENLGLRRTVPEDHFTETLLSLSYTTTNVISSVVCTIVCLDPDLDETVNAWIYNFNSKRCSCVWIKSTTCQQDSLVNRNISGLSSYIADTEGYIQQRKILDCSKCQ